MYSSRRWRMEHTGVALAGLVRRWQPMYREAVARGATSVIWAWRHFGLLFRRGLGVAVGIVAVILGWVDGNGGSSLIVDGLVHHKVDDLAPAVGGEV